RLLRILRVPVGPGNGGKVFAVALSPDGSLVAAAGWDARGDSEQHMSIYLFDASTGVLKGRVGNFENVIGHLSFSPDGRQIAVTLGSEGARLIDVEQMTETAADRDYGAIGYGAAFGPDGRLYTVAWDGFLRAYGPGLKLQRKVKLAGGAKPF